MYTFCSITNKIIEAGDSVVLFKVSKDKTSHPNVPMKFPIIEDKSIDLPIFGTFDGYGHIEEEEIEEPVYKKSHFIFAHKKAYDALIDYNRLDANVLWDHKEIILANLYKELSRRTGKEIEDIQKNIDFKDKLIPETIVMVYFNLNSNNTNEERSNILSLLSITQSQRTKNDIREIYKSLHHDDKETCIATIQPYMDKLTFIFNMHKIGRDLNQKILFGEEYHLDLHKTLDKVSKEIQKKINTNLEY